MTDGQRPGIDQARVLMHDVGKAITMPLIDDFSYDFSVTRTNYYTKLRKSLWVIGYWLLKFVSLRDD